MATPDCRACRTRVPLQVLARVARRRPVRVDGAEQQRHRLALHRAQPALARRVGAPDHAVAHEVVH
eukprot:1664713-Prymnesium_polylepis.1